jgi:hypothetical protein
MYERASFSTDRTVTNAHVVQIGIDFESHFAAMAGALVGFFHGAP